MDLNTFADTLSPADAERMREHLERVQAEEREWATARLHRAIHGTWLSPDECPTCLSEREAAS